MTAKALSIRLLAGIAITVVLFLLFACYLGKENSFSRSASGIRPICENWAKVSLGEYEINNNIWGNEGVKNYKQCIFGVMDSYSELPATLGWSWHWPKSEDGVKAYPSVLYGRKPWNKYSTTSRLPRMLDQMQQLLVTYKLQSTSSGAVNLLLESWITTTLKATPKDRSGELAIHLYQKHWPGQAGKFIETVVINNISFDFYLEKKMRVPGDNHRWAYYGFVHEGEPLLQGKLDMMKFVNYLIEKGHVNPHHYIATVELGNEVDYGDGETVIERFSVQPWQK